MIVRTKNKAAVRCTSLAVLIVLISAMRKRHCFCLYLI